MKNCRVTLIALLISLNVAAAHAEDPTPLPRMLEFDGGTRTYYLFLPENFEDTRLYWPLVVVHGGGGKADKNPKAHAIRREADQQGLDAIVIAPQFNVDDRQVSRFPTLGEGAFLKAVLTHAGKEFNLRPKILLNGYSMGGQFAHRFALQNPELVQACAPFAAGTWTTPQGTLLIQEYGEVAEPATFLLDQANTEGIPERLHALFDARTAAVAGLAPANGANAVPFLVMCGALDPRISIARTFATRLGEAGYTVETAWPKTPHGNPEGRYTEEFERYTRSVVAFFKKHTQD